MGTCPSIGTSFSRGQGGCRGEIAPIVSAGPTNFRSAEGPTNFRSAEGPTNMHDVAAGGVAGRSLGADCPGAVDASDESDSDDGGDSTAVALPAPPRPTPHMVADHQVAHIPFRSWCPACVRGRTRKSCHYDRKWPDDVQLPVVSIDYCSSVRMANPAAMGCCRP